MRRYSIVAIDVGFVRSFGAAKWQRQTVDNKTDLRGLCVLKRLPCCFAVAWAKDRWIAVGASGSHESVDNGNTWKLLDRENYNSVAFAAGGEGWAVGPKGRIARYAR